MTMVVLLLGLEVLPTKSVSELLRGALSSLRHHHSIDARVKG